MSNEVTNFMYYIFNKWTVAEARCLFGDPLGEHIFSKWCDCMPDALSWYAELDNRCKQMLVDRANEIYNK
jgi:truncated hemoglobin YjbI